MVDSETVKRRIVEDILSRRAGGVDKAGPEERVEAEATARRIVNGEFDEESGEKYVDALENLRYKEMLGKSVAGQFEVIGGGSWTKPLDGDNISKAASVEEPFGVFSAYIAFNDDADGMHHELNAAAAKGKRLSWITALRAISDGVPFDDDPSTVEKPLLTVRRTTNHHVSKEGEDGAVVLRVRPSFGPGRSENLGRVRSLILPIVPQSDRELGSAKGNILRHFDSEKGFYHKILGAIANVSCLNLINRNGGAPSV